MALTAAQKSTSNRVNLGGDALEALQAVQAAAEAVQVGTDYVVSARYTATITASALLTAAGGFTAVFAANTVRIILIPRGDMYWNIGAAADNTKSLIGQGTPLNMPITKTVADTVYVYAAGAGVVCDLLVCTPRA